MKANLPQPRSATITNPRLGPSVQGQLPATAGTGQFADQQAVSLTRISAARHAYFEQGLASPGWVSDPVLRGWERCRAQGRKPGERIAFEPVTSSRLATLDDQFHGLIDTARPELDALAGALSGAGYGIFFINADGINLHVAGRSRQWGDLMRLAARHGVDLSEAAIGASTIGNVLFEQRPVSVYRNEHFMEINAVFDCVAAPVFGPCGELVGAVDATRDMQGAQLDALRLVETCAALIEAALVMQVPAAATLALSWHPVRAHPLDTALLSFGTDGELLGTNDIARQLLGATVGNHAGRPAGSARHRLSFAQIFDLPFGAAMSRLRTSEGGAARTVQLHLVNGLALYASLVVLNPQHSGTEQLPAAPNRATPLRARIPTAADAEREAIELALDQMGGNISKAARLLGLSRSTLHRRLKAGTVH